MKVLSALLCLTLAYGVSASIFKQYSQFIPGLNIKEFDYNDQQRHREHHPGHNKHSEHHVDNQQYQPKPNHQDYTPSEQFNHQYSQQYSQSSEQKYTDQQWNQPQNVKDTQDQPQSQQYESQYQPSSTQKLQEPDQPYTHFQQSSLSYDEQKYHHSSSSESHSQESKEKRNNYNNVQPGYGDNQQWGSAQQSSNQDNDMFNNEDDVQWRNLKMTVGPNISVQEKENIEKIFRDAQSAMKHPTEEEKMKYHEALDLQLKKGDENNVILNATQLAQKHQYPIEKHTVRTDDGYELTVFRIPPKNHPRGVQKSPVVFLMHGILGSADDWIVTGPQKSLAYLLSDAGYDVWLGNARGNKYSQYHVSKSPALHDFWQFSNDDIALHDLPAMIDYALNTTRQEQLSYVGYSQGNTIFFALNAARPEYNSKIKHMYALSPMVYMTNVRSPFIRMSAPDSKYYSILQRQLGNGPFDPSTSLKRTLGGTLLEKETGSERVATHINTVMSGFHAEEEDLPTYHVVMQHIPAGTSSKVVRQYSQGVTSQEFQRYDYGHLLNHDVYGSEQPPKYDVQRVTAPVTLYYSEEDWLAHPLDVERLKNELPNVKEAYKVPEPHFSNMDFQYSSKAPEIVYKRVIGSMKNDQ